MKMTTGELIEALQKFPANTPVVLWDYHLSTMQTEMQVMHLDSEDVRTQPLVWCDKKGLGWLEVAREDSLNVVSGVVLGPRERC
ncbi:MAG: hypothetical protein JSS56_04675 [Proteobacteria bacterium]|nr:hypothetical protein [Pseudomonadota bacterium]